MLAIVYVVMYQGIYMYMYLVMDVCRNVCMYVRICVCMYVLIMDVAFPHMWYVVAYMLCRSCDALLVLCHILALLPKYMLHCYFWCATACGLVDCVLCLKVVCYVVAVCVLLLRCRLWGLVHYCVLVQARNWRASMWCAV